MMQMKRMVLRWALALAATGMLAGPALAAEGLGAEAPGVLALQPVQAVAVDEQVAELVAELPAPPALAEVATQAAAGTLPAELPGLPAALALAQPEPFSADDMQALFVPGHEPLRVAVLSPQEMEETKGAIAPVVAYGLMVGSRIAYVGITNNLARRTAQHATTRTFSRVVNFGSSPDRTAARVIEQNNINRFNTINRGWNRINSISPRNPLAARVSVPFRR